MPINAITKLSRPFPAFSSRAEPQNKRDRAADMLHLLQMTSSARRSSQRLPHSPGRPSVRVVTQASTAAVDDFSAALTFNPALHRQVVDILRSLRIEDARPTAMGMPALVVDPMAKRIMATAVQYVQLAKSARAERGQDIRSEQAGNEHLLMAVVLALRLAAECPVFTESWARSPYVDAAEKSEWATLMRLMPQSENQQRQAAWLEESQQMLLLDMDFAAYVRPQKLDEVERQLDVWLAHPAFKSHTDKNNQLLLSDFCCSLATLLRLRCGRLRLLPALVRAATPQSPQSPLLPVTPNASRVYQITEHGHLREREAQDYLACRPAALPDEVLLEQQAFSEAIALSQVI